MKGDDELLTEIRERYSVAQALFDAISFEREQAVPSLERLAAKVREAMGKERSQPFLVMWRRRICYKINTRAELIKRIGAGKRFERVADGLPLLGWPEGFEVLTKRGNLVAVLNGDPESLPEM